jgi:AcrR family transcriptional regulator
MLRAAKRLFARDGYEQTATSAIAREAGTSESQLMRYFGGKVGLLQALFDVAWVDLEVKVKKALAAPATAREQILNVLDTVSAALGRDTELATLFLFEARRVRAGEPRVLMSKGFLSFTDLLRGIVRRGQASGEFARSLDANAMTSAMIGAAEAMIRDRLLARASGGRRFAQREIRRTIDSMLGGFTTGSARPRRAASKAR